MKKIMIYAFILVYMAGFVGAQLDPCSNYNITFVSKEPVNGDWNWTYKICQKSTPAISHWVLESCICSAYGSLAACNDSGVISGYGSSLGTVTLEYGTDPGTGIRGFKFEEFSENFQCATFWIVTRISDWELQDVGLKAGGLNCTDYDQVKGPAHETTTVPEFSSLAVALMILLTTPAFAYLIAKKKH